jgi:hypothetical protein
LLPLVVAFPFLTLSLFADWRSDPPLVVCGYLKDLGLQTGKYRNAYADDYGAGSPYKEIGDPTDDPSLRNNIAYYVEGRRQAVTSLTLMLNVNRAKEAGPAIEEFRRASLYLVLRAVKPVPSTNELSEIEKSVTEGRLAEWKLSGTTAKLSRRDWPTGKGYDLSLTLKGERSEGSSKEVNGK